MSDELNQSRDFEVQQFHPEPRSSTEYLAALWQKVNVIDSKVSMTNGRVTKLERAIWALGGGLIVIAAVVVPLFVYLVTHTLLS